MRLFEISCNGLQLFCALMKLTPKFSRESYYHNLEKVKIVSKALTDICLKNVGEQRKQKNRRDDLSNRELGGETVETFWFGFGSLISVSIVITKYPGELSGYFSSSENLKHVKL